MADYHVRDTILRLLVRVEQDSGFIHTLIDQEIKAQRIAPDDEALMTEIVYGTIQRQLTLDYYLKPFIRSRKNLSLWVRILLRMSVYQMQFLDKVPDHAVIHEAVEIAKRRGHKGIASFVNGVLRAVQRQGVPDTSMIQDWAERLAVETSHPLWLVKRWRAIYGNDLTFDMCHANLERKPLSIRVQPLKITREKAMEELAKLGVISRKSCFSNQGMIIEKGNIIKTWLFQENYVTIQDQSSMLATEMLHIEPGLNVLDACSAPGGKATHIAEKMQDSGTIAARDLQPKKVKQIRQKAAHLDLTIIDARASDARDLQDQYEKEYFDRILVDAPCTGFGVIRGKPDIKYHKEEADSERLAQIQTAILDEIAPLLKQDGLLLYSTCTVERRENNDVIADFLKQHPDFTVDECFFEELPSMFRQSPGCSEIGLQLFPQTFSTDGFFMTRLRKKA